MPIRILEQKIVPITKKLAAEFSEMLASTGECAFDAVHMENLAVLMESGPFHAPVWASVFCKEDGKTYRGDGKHSSGIFHMGRLPVGERKVHLHLAECDRKSEVGDFYNQFNQPETSRCPREINQSIASQIPALATMNRSFIDGCVSGIDMSVRGTAHQDGTGKVSKLMKAKRLRDEVKFVVFLDAIHDPPGVVSVIKHIKTVPVIAACHSSFHENSAVAREFWTLVRDGSNPNHADPDRALYEFLRTAKLGVTRNKEKQAVLASDVRRKCLELWEDFKAVKSGGATRSPKPRFKGRGRRRRELAESSS